MEAYDNYNLFDFSIPIGIEGDCFDRYCVRVEEMRESLSIMSQCIYYLNGFSSRNKYDYLIRDNKIVPPARAYIKYSMESLIHHFKLYTEGFIIPYENIYSVVEAPKGEFGIFMQANDSNKPYRCRIKAPGFLHLQGLDYMCINSYLADLVTIIGSQDLVFGEIDR